MLQKVNSLYKMAERRPINAAVAKANYLALKRRASDKMKLYSYLSVCVDVGQINRAFNLLLKNTYPKLNPILDVSHYNIVLKGWAKLRSVPQINETRLCMIRNNIEPNAETFLYTLLGYCRSYSSTKKNGVSKVLQDMKRSKVNARLLFQAAYLNPIERRLIKRMLKLADPKYSDEFLPVPIEYDCKLLSDINQITTKEYRFADSTDLSKLESWAEHQRMIEWKSSITIKSIANLEDSKQSLDRYSKIWHKLQEMWKKSLTKALDEDIEALSTQAAISDKIHLYPYLCSVDRIMLVHLLLDEIEINASSCNYSLSTTYLHSRLGSKVMNRYLRSKAIADGSYHEKQRMYADYLSEYCINPKLMSRINSREYIQNKAEEKKIYAVYKDRINPIEEWPNQIISAVGRFLYGILLREVKFDPDIVRSFNKEIKTSNLVNVFYTAYFQIECSHKIKEEFRANTNFERLYRKSCSNRLRFDYSYLPCSSPPYPWLSFGTGGYLTNKSELVRFSDFSAEQISATTRDVNVQKLYPSLDSVNALGLCPWIVNKEILDLVIDLFKQGGDTELCVPLEESKMDDDAPTLKSDSTKADKILYNKEKKKFDQKRREMYSMWRDCLYRLSIANHFRDRIFWFPHNMDFRGRTYPIPPHFNHLGSDLARSLLLFARGEPLGDKGLDWLKIHLINLVGNMKSCSLQDRLEYANSILHLEVLDSADNPWDGRKWWTRNENPWQVLACCKEIAKAIRSLDYRLYHSHFPIHQDGSCNGLQHYAALGRDYSGAQAVNLVPSAKPQDVYSRVVDIVEDMRKKDLIQGVKNAEMLSGFIQRKVIKQTVMTTVYGVTRFGARQQIARQLAAKNYPEREVWAAASYLTSKTFSSIGQMFNKSRIIQDWLTDCAYIIASRFKQSVSWETPLGFPITQPYTIRTRNGSEPVNSSLIGCNITSEFDNIKLNAPKQKTAFPPNYIHSLDSAHMMLTSLYCQKAGVTFVSVHDCYWTHPSSVDVMNQICREQFVNLHSQPLLEDLSQQFIKKYANFESRLDTKKAGKQKSNQRQLDKTLVKLKSKEISNVDLYDQDSGYDDIMVDDDLRILMNETSELEEEEELSNVDSRHDEITTKSLKNKIDNLQQVEKGKSLEIFKNVPAQGELDLKLVLKSTYFFS